MESSVRGSSLTSIEFIVSWDRMSSSSAAVSRTRYGNRNLSMSSYRTNPLVRPLRTNCSRCSEFPSDGKLPPQRRGGVLGPPTCWYVGSADRCLRCKVLRFESCVHANDSLGGHLGHFHAAVIVGS